MPEALRDLLAQEPIRGYRTTQLAREKLVEQLALNMESGAKDLRVR